MGWDWAAVVLVLPMLWQLLLVFIVCRAIGKAAHVIAFGLGRRRDELTPTVKLGDGRNPLPPRVPPPPSGGHMTRGGDR